MAKTEAEIQAAIEEIAAVCRKHGVFLAGTSLTEGLSGEIVVLERDEVLATLHGGIALSDVDNQVYRREDSDCFCVDAIG